MKEDIASIAADQLRSGQFPTQMRNTDTGEHRIVHTLCPTYLTVLLLSLVREKSSYSTNQLDLTIKRGAEFLLRMAYRDPISGLIVWHFNSFYQPDSEETSACAMIVYNEGLVSRNDIVPLRDHLLRTEGQKGVAVWLVDDYSPGNVDRKPVYDPIVSMMVLNFLQRVFNDYPERTKKFVMDSVTNAVSHYYSAQYRLLLAKMLGFPVDSKATTVEEGEIFHHQSRPEVTYWSSAVLRSMQLLMS